MPSLNTARYIREALDSVVNQTLKDIEIICIDAGSTDGTREIIGEYAERDSRIRVIDSPVKSYGYQMNVGLDAAKGSYIGIVEPDDYVLPEMYEELYGQAISENLDVIKGNCNFCSTGKDGSAISRFQPLFTAWGRNKNRYGCVFDMADVP
jgi:glycosyltransferase involved in cell wall biosynthesis